MKNREGSIFKRISGYLSTFLVPAGLSINMPAMTVPDTAPVTETIAAVEQVKITEISDSFESFSGISYIQPSTQTYTATANKSHSVTSNSLTTNTTPVERPANPFTNSITIGGRTISTFHTDTTTIDAGTSVARYGNKFLFGHNTSAVFGHLKNLPIGTTFSLTEDNISTNYHIVEAITLEKPEVSRFMNAIVDGRYKSGRYDLSIMTCAGKSLGGGDATHRLIIFANRI